MITFSLHKTLISLYFQQHDHVFVLLMVTCKLDAYFTFCPSEL